MMMAEIEALRYEPQFKHCRKSPKHSMAGDLTAW